MLRIEKFSIAHQDAKNICDIIAPKDIITDFNPKIKIFAVLKCEKTEENKKILDSLNQKIKEYYNYRKERIIRLKEENIFENFLYNINIEFHKFFKGSTDIKKINFLIGIIYFDEKKEKYNLYFSQIGNIAPLIIYKTKNEKYNIARIQEAIDEKPRETKIFLNMISGQIKKDNSVIFCSKNTLDYISLDKIINIAKDNKAIDIAQEIKNLLIEIDDKDTFCGLVIKDEEDNKNFSITSEANKIEKKIDEKREIKPIKEETGVKNEPEIKKEKNNNKKQIFSKILDIIKSLISKTLYLIGFIITGKIFTKIAHLPKWFKSLTILRKLLLLTIIILLILFVQNTINIKQKNIIKEREQKYQELISQIENKKNDLEASLMFKSRNKSTSILLKLKNLIKQLPQESEEQRKKLSEIEQEIKKMEFKVKSISEIIEPKKLADYSKLYKMPMTKIVKEGNKIYSITEDNNIFQLNLQDKSIQKIDCQQLSLPAAKSIIKNDKNFIILHQKNNFSKLEEKDNKFQPIEVKFPKNNIDISAIGIYNHKLYTLDILNNQIYKHFPLGDDFSKGKEWIDKDINLNKAVSMSIDGAIYVLNSDGEIFKLFKGKKENFSFNNTNKILTDPEKIWTNSNSLYLYVLDAGGRKIAIIDKNGKLIIQYYSDKFDKLNDFAIDEKEKKIYVLSNNKIFAVKITHLSSPL